MTSFDLYASYAVVNGPVRIKYPCACEDANRPGRGRREIPLEGHVKLMHARGVQGLVLLE